MHNTLIKKGPVRNVDQNCRSYNIQTAHVLHLHSVDNKTNLCPACLELYLCYFFGDAFFYCSANVSFIFSSGLFFALQGLPQVIIYLGLTTFCRSASLTPANIISS